MVLKTGAPNRRWKGDYDVHVDDALIMCQRIFKHSAVCNIFRRANHTEKFIKLQISVEIKW